ncbi:MAG: hypothetical protein PWP72_2039 [Thermoanaerobacter sp.]|nr:hypothetical protein [Thermoanaerobacter sp.]
MKIPLTQTQKQRLRELNVEPQVLDMVFNSTEMRDEFFKNLNNEYSIQAKPQLKPKPIVPTSGK